MRDARGDAPLSLAAARGHAAAVGALLHAGAEPDPVSMGELGMITPLGAAACGDSSEHASCVSLLLAAGAVLNPEAELGLAPPLWCAASAGAARCVAVLLAHGAAVEAAHMGRTPLMAAAAAGCPGSVWLLLEAGADLAAAGSDGGHGRQRACTCSRLGGAATPPGPLLLGMAILKRRLWVSAACTCSVSGAPRAGGSSMPCPPSAAPPLPSALQAAPPCTSPPSTAGPACCACRSCSRRAQT